MATIEEIFKGPVSETDLVEHLTRSGVIEARSVEKVLDGYIVLGRGYLLHPKKVPNETQKWRTVENTCKYPYDGLESPSVHDVNQYKEMYPRYRTDLKNIQGFCTVLDFSSGMLFLAEEAVYEDGIVKISSGKCIPMAVHKENSELGIKIPFFEFSCNPKLPASHDIGYILQENPLDDFIDLDDPQIREPELLTV